jgi:hypothetical protein
VCVPFFRGALWSHVILLHSHRKNDQDPSLTGPEIPSGKFWWDPGYPAGIKLESWSHSGGIDQDPESMHTKSYMYCIVVLYVIEDYHKFNSPTLVLCQ